MCSAVIHLWPSQKIAQTFGEEMRHFSVTSFELLCNQIYFNAENMKGVANWPGTHQQYINYIVQHELGHAIFNLQHVDADQFDRQSGQCDVMTQQTEMRIPENAFDRLVCQPGHEHSVYDSTTSKRAKLAGGAGGAGDNLVDFEVCIVKSGTVKLVKGTGKERTVVPYELNDDREAHILPTASMQANTASIGNFAAADNQAMKAIAKTVISYYRQTVGTLKKNNKEADKAAEFLVVDKSEFDSEENKDITTCSEKVIAFTYTQSDVQNQKEPKRANAQQTHVPNVSQPVVAQRVESIAVMRKMTKLSLVNNKLTLFQFQSVCQLVLKMIYLIGKDIWFNSNDWMLNMWIVNWNGQATLECMYWGMLFKHAKWRDEKIAAYKRFTALVASLENYTYNAKSMLPPLTTPSTAKEVPSVTALNKQFVDYYKEMGYNDKNQLEKKPASDNGGVSGDGGDGGGGGDGANHSGAAVVNANHGGKVSEKDCAAIVKRNNPKNKDKYQFETYSYINLSKLPSRKISLLPDVPKH